MRTLVVLSILALSTLSAAGQQAAEPRRGLLPSEAPAPAIPIERPQRDGTTDPVRPEQARPTLDINGISTDYEMRVAAFSDPRVSVEGLVGLSDQISPELGILSNFVERRLRSMTRNELDVNERRQRESIRIRQNSLSKEFTIGAQATLGEYDTATSTFSLSNIQLMAVELPSPIQTRVQFELVNPLSFRFLPAPNALARDIVNRLPANRKIQINVTVKAATVAMDTSPSVGQLAFLMFVEPMQAEWWVQDLRDGRSGFLVGRSTYRNEASTPNDSWPRTTGLEAFVLDQETVAMLLIREMKYQADDQIYIQMMINRWILERQPSAVTRMNEAPLIQRNEFGKFYPDLAPLPNAAALQLDLPRFRSWVRARAETLPKRILLHISDHSNGDCRSFGQAAGWGTSDTTPWLLDGIITRETARSLTQSHLNQINRNRQLNRIGTVGPYFAALSTGVDMCPTEPRIGLDRLRNTLLQLPQNLRPVSYPLGIVEIPVFAESTEILAERRGYLVSADLGSIKVLSDPRGSTRVHLGLVPTRISTTHEDRDRQIVTRELMGDAALRDLVSLTSPRTIPAADHVAANADDVRGLRIGMTVDEADRIIRDRIRVREVVRFAPANAALGLSITGRIYVEQDKKEYITLIEQPAYAPGIVLSVGRLVSEGPGSFDAETVIESLRDKYKVEFSHATTPGPPAYVFARYDDRRSQARNSTACRLQFGSLVRNVRFERTVEKNQDLNQLVPDWLQNRASFQDISFTMIYPQEHLTLPDKFYDCNPLVLSWLPQKTGPIAMFSVWLVDPARYIKVIQDGLARGATSPNTPPRRPQL